MRAFQEHAGIRGGGRAGRWPRLRRAALPIALILLGAGLLVTLTVWSGPGFASARVAEGASGSGGGGEHKIAVFEDVTIGPGDSWEQVVVVGGDLVVEGTVEDLVVIVGGDLTVGREAQVGVGAGPDDVVVVSVLGAVEIEPGGTVLGRTIDVAGGVSDIRKRFITDPIVRPWRVDSIVNWIWSTVFLAVVAVVAAAIAPRQLAAVRNRVRQRFFSSLGWGALGTVVGIPLATAVLILTIIGIIFFVPWLFVALPFMFLFGLAAVGAALGKLIMRAREDRRVTIMAAAVIGLVVINLVRWIPVAGIVIIGLLSLVGFGATYMAIWAWLMDRRRTRREAAKTGHVAGPGVTGAPPYSPPGAPGAPPSSAATGAVSGPEARAVAAPEADSTAGGPPDGSFG